MKAYIYLLILFLTAATNDSFSQLKIRMQGTAALPTGYTEDAVSAGFGGNLNLSYYVYQQNLEISLTAGYFHFGLKENLPDYDFSFNSMPLLAGVRFNFTDYDFIPYIGIETGWYFSEYFLQIDYGYFGKLDIVTKDAQWGFSPEAGFRMNISPSFDIDLNLKYNNIRTKYIARSFLLIQSGFAYRF